MSGEKKTGMESMMEYIAKAIFGPEGAAQMRGIMDGLFNSAKAVEKAQEKILLQQTDIQDRLGRIEKALHVPPVDAAPVNHSLNS